MSGHVGLDGAEKKSVELGLKSMIFRYGDHTLCVDIQKDINEWAYTILNKEGFEKIDRDNALRQYCNVMIRLLEAKPRKIVKAKEFICPQDAEEALILFENAVKSGFKLIHFMTKTIMDASSFDKMINDWGIFHFHLSTEIDERDSRFMGRGDYLLIAYVDPYDDNTMYFLQVRSHKNMNWSEQELIRILADNWPDMMDRYRLRGVDSLTKLLSDQDYARIRKANINAAVDLHDGRVFMGANVGLAGDGSSVRAGINFNRMMNDAARMQLSIEKNIKLICSTIDSALTAPESNYALSLITPGMGKYVFSINSSMDALVGTAINKNDKFAVVLCKYEEVLVAKLNEFMQEGN